METAGLLVLLYYVGIMAGRFLGSALMKWIKAEKMLVGLGSFGVALLLISMFYYRTGRRLEPGAVRPG